MMSNRPLAGKRIVITRAAGQAAALCALLVAEGAEPILLPTIQFVPLSPEPLLAALRRINQYDWLLFTSANAVEFFFRQVETLAEPPALPRLAAVGPATAARLETHQQHAGFLPDEYSGEALATGLGKLAGQRLLLPRSRKGRPQLVEQLRAQDAIVDEIAIYDTIPAIPQPETVSSLGGGFEAIIFTSPSTVQGFQAIFDQAHLDRALLDPVTIACIGPTTARQAEKLGFSVTIVADVATTEGIVRALRHYWSIPSPAS